MSLSAQSVQSKLVDILQANSIGKNTCRIQVSTPRGRGVIHMEDGDVSDALFGDLTGEDAFSALWNSEGADCVVSLGLKNGKRSIHESLQTLMLNAMTLRFEDRLPVRRSSSPPRPLRVPILSRRARKRWLNRPHRPERAGRKRSRT